MSVYGRVARQAVTNLESGVADDPRAAWHQAAEKLIPKSHSSREKGCPKDAFLGLCEAGMVIHVPAGRYINRRNSKNKAYAVNAARWLAAHPDADPRRNELWDIARHGIANPASNENGQMDVVMVLWIGGFLDPSL